MGKPSVGYGLQPAAGSISQPIPSWEGPPNLFQLQGGGGHPHQLGGFGPFTSRECLATLISSKPLITISLYLPPLTSLECLASLSRVCHFTLNGREGLLPLIRWEGFCPVTCKECVCQSPSRSGYLLSPARCGSAFFSTAGIPR